MVKNLPASAGDIGDTGFIPGWERSPGGENGNPLQYFPGKFHGQRSLVGYSPWGHKEFTQLSNWALTLGYTQFSMLWWFQVHSEATPTALSPLPGGMGVGSNPDYTLYWRHWNMCFSVTACRQLTHTSHSHPGSHIPHSLVPLFLVQQLVFLPFHTLLGQNQKNARGVMKEINASYKASRKPIATSGKAHCIVLQLWAGGIS